MSSFPENFATEGAGPRDPAPVHDSTLTDFFKGCSDGRIFTLHEVIGKGSYGIVCSATDKLTGERVAIKKIQNVFDNVGDATRILREITLLRLMKHADIVDMHRILLPDDSRKFKDLYIVFELFESDLHTVITVNDDLTPDHYKVFLYQLLRGINFIHQSGVLHRDLKPKNILANSNCKLKICDLGLARPLVDEDTQEPVFWTDYIATRWYRSPELCGCFYGHYSQAVDIWSIGCIFAEILLGKPLFPGSDAVVQLQLITDLMGKPSNETIERISNRKARQFLHQMAAKPGVPFEHVFRGVDAQALDLLQKMLSFDPLERPSAVEALQHPYFDKLPEATAQADRLPKSHFAFEHCRLSETDLRELIYEEVLNYHPKMKAVYESGNKRLQHQALVASIMDQYGLYHQLQQQQQQQQQQQLSTSVEEVTQSAAPHAMVAVMPGMFPLMDTNSLGQFLPHSLMPHAGLHPMYPLPQYFPAQDASHAQALHHESQQHQAALAAHYQAMVHQNAQGIYGPPQACVPLV